MTTPFGTTVTQNGNAISFSYAIPSASGQIVYDSLAAGGNGNWDPGTGQSTLWENNDNEFSGGSYQYTSGASTTMSWTNDTGADTYAYIAVPINFLTPAGATPATNLDGFYSTDGSFIINSNSSCDTNQLQIGGSVVVNAGLQSGTFQNNRNLCSQNANCPSVTFTARPDLLLNTPAFVKTTNHVWQEIAP